MSIFGLATKKEVQAAVDAAIKAVVDNIPRWLLTTAEAERFTMPDPSVYGNQADLFRTLSWVLQAVEITAHAGAVTRFDVKRVINDKEPKDIPNHPFEMLLRRPNPLDSRFEFLSWTITMFKLTGNAYWWMNRPGGEFAAPSELWGIPTHKIIPVPDGRSYIRGYLYRPGNGAEILLPPHEIVHFKRTNPASRFIGLSAIEAIALIAQGDLGMQKFNTTLFQQNNGRLPSILAFEQMIADPTWDKIKADTREASRNRDMLMLRGVGQAGGLQWLQNGISQREMEFLAGRQANKEEIYNTLAPGLFSMLSENATEANSRTGRAAFNELTLYPMHVMMSEKITNDILPIYGTEMSRPLIGLFEDIRMADKAMELDEIARYSETHTIKEIREEWYSDDPLGDERDDLLPAQIKPESGGIQEPEPPPVAPGTTPDGMPMEKPEMDAANPPKEEPKQDETTKMVLDELARYERKARRLVGSAVEFTSDILPGELHTFINGELSSCKSETAVRMVFEKARLRVKHPKTDAPTITPAPLYDNSALITLAKSLDNFAAAYKAQATPTAPAANIYLPAQTFNLPPAENTYQFNMPNQDAPQTFVNVHPTIEAAKTPDVQISSPVTIHQTVEPSPAPNVETPVTINQTIEAQEPMKLDIPAPVTNVTVENQIPEQPAPVTNVTVENKVEPTPVKFDIETPAPVVNVKNEVKTPKVKRTKSRVSRDAGNNIEGQDTEYEYEDDK